MRLLKNGTRHSENYVSLVMGAIERLKPDLAAATRTELYQAYKDPVYHVTGPALERLYNLDLVLLNDGRVLRSVADVLESIGFDGSAEWSDDPYEPENPLSPVEYAPPC